MKNYTPKDKRLSLTTCKKILNKDGLNYTDEEIILIRDWLYHMAEIAIDVLDEKETKILEQKKSIQI